MTDQKPQISSWIGFTYREIGPIPRWRQLWWDIKDWAARTCCDLLGHRWEYDEEECASWCDRCCEWDDLI